MADFIAYNFTTLTVSLSYLMQYKPYESYLNAEIAR